MKAYDTVRVAVHGEREGSVATVLRVRDGGLSIAVEFSEPPPFAILHGNRRIVMYLHREAVDGRPVGPWVELFGGGHYEVEVEAEAETEREATDGSRG